MRKHAESRQATLAAIEVTLALLPGSLANEIRLSPPAVLLEIGLAAARCRRDLNPSSSSMYFSVPARQNRLGAQ